MAGALPNGYVDTGVCTNISGGGQMRVWITNIGGGDDILIRLAQGTATLEQYFQYRYHHGATVSIGDYTLEGLHNANSSGEWAVVCLLYGPGPALPKVIHKEYHSDGTKQEPDGSVTHGTSWPGGWSPWVSVSYTDGPYRLGMKYLFTPGMGDANRSLGYGCLHGEMRYSWFRDAGAVRVSSGGGTSYTTEPAEEISEMGHEIGGITWGFFTGTWDRHCAEWQGLYHNDGIISTVGLDGYDEVGAAKHWIYGNGDGACYAQVPQSEAGVNAAGATWALPTTRCSYTLDISRYGEPANDWAVIRDAFVTVPGGAPYQETLSGGNHGPFVGTTQGWRAPTKLGWDLSRGVSFTFDSEWASKDEPPWLPLDWRSEWNTSDLSIPIRVLHPAPPHYSDGVYCPGTLRVRERVNINRPEGTPNPSHWRAVNTEAILVDDYGETTLVTIIQAGGALEREFKTCWRHYIAKPVDPEITPYEEWDPLYDANRYMILKHNAFYPTPVEGGYKYGGEVIETDEDVWWWGTYGFAEMAIRFTPPEEEPAAKPDALVLTVACTHLDVSDPFTVRLRDRVAGMEYTETPATYTYTLLFHEDLLGSDGIYRIPIDLLYPEEGGPIALGRVDKLTLAGWRKGGYEIVDFSLVAKLRCDLKLGFGTPKRVSTEKLDEVIQDRLGDQAGEEIARQKPAWSTFQLTVDGAQVYGELPTTDWKAHERGERGGSPRYITPAISDQVGRMDSQISIQGLLGWLGWIEGLEVQYDADGSRHANTDSYGVNVLGPQNADWLEPMIPRPRNLDGPLMPGQELRLEAAPTCHTVRLTNLVDYTVGCRHAVGASLETLLVGPDGRRFYEEATVHLVYHPKGHADPARLERIKSVTAEKGHGGWIEVYPVPANNGDPEATASAFTLLGDEEWQEAVAGGHADGHDPD